jgi:hypothetical protein
MLAVLWPFGFPVRFADSGGAQTRGACPESSRRAQTMRAFFLVSAALLGHNTRPEKLTERMGPFLIWRANSRGSNKPAKKKSVRSWDGRQALEFSTKLSFWATGEKSVPRSRMVFRFGKEAEGIWVFGFGLEQFSSKHKSFLDLSRRLLNYHL